LGGDREKVHFWRKLGEIWTVRVVNLVVLATVLRATTFGEEKCTPEKNPGYAFRGVARNLLRGTNQEVWGPEVPSEVQGQNMETLENTNWVVTKTDLRWREDMHPCPPLATPLYA